MKLKVKIIMIASVLMCILSACQASQEVTNETAVTLMESDLWDETATQIILEDSGVSIEGDGASESDGVITIETEGTYVFNGTLKDGQVQVDAEDEEVQIVLNGVDITCSDSAVIYVKKAKEVTLTIAEGSQNTLTDAEEYSYTEEETDPDAAIFSKADLYINGKGELTINGNYNHAVASKDALYLENATINIEAVQDGFHAKKEIIISSGILTLAVGDDAIHTDKTLTVNGGTIAVDKCEEGLEGAGIEINSGDITITSNDDGINAANTEETEKSHDIIINGGTILVDAMGDGIDANGSITMTGGNVTIYGPTNDGNGSIDYDDSFTISGGTLLASGSSGMAQGISEDSTQNALMVVFDQQQEAGTTFEIESADEASIVSVSPDKAYQCILISMGTLEQNTEYKVMSKGEELTSITLTQIMTSISEDGTEVQIGMMGAPEGPGGNMPGDMPELPAGKQQEGGMQFKKPVDRQQDGGNVITD